MGLAVVVCRVGSVLRQYNRNEKIISDSHIDRPW